MLLQNVSVFLFHCCIIFHCVNVPQLFYQLILDYFQILAIVNNAAMNKGVHIFFCIGVLGSLGYIPGNGISRSKGSLVFKILRILYIVFHSGCTRLHSHQQCTRVSLSLHPRQYMSFVDILMVVTLMDVR